jgi:aspartyl-tRNA(Asn)/glutamyl-tRNA(Gln) amidotransferase subunit B
MAVRFGLATGATVRRRSVFARKNYFYPDLPKGYQISQYELPIVEDGSLDILLEDGGRSKTIGITRAHLEEDAGKSLHEDFQSLTGIDLNRAGTPLLEIVSEPDMRSAREAIAYMKKVHTLVRYLGICDGNMQEGSFRCDANVSVRPLGPRRSARARDQEPNSFRFVERAINHEVARQIGVLESGGSVVQETRLYDPDRNETRAMRSKEEANDYRYFPDPDLLPLAIDDALIEQVRSTLPELPDEKAARYSRDFELSAYDAGVLTASRELASCFEIAVVGKLGGHPKLAANWVMGEALGCAQPRQPGGRCEPGTGARLTRDSLARISDGMISGKLARKSSRACGPRTRRGRDHDARGLRRSLTAAHRRSTRSWRQSEAACRVPQRQGQSSSGFRRAGDEGDTRQGEPGAQRASKAEARRRLIRRARRAAARMPSRWP